MVNNKPLYSIEAAAEALTKHLSRKLEAQHAFKLLPKEAEFTITPGATKKTLTVTSDQATLDLIMAYLSDIGIPVSIRSTEEGKPSQTIVVKSPAMFIMTLREQEADHATAKVMFPEPTEQELKWREESARRMRKRLLEMPLDDDNDKSPQR